MNQAMIVKTTLGSWTLAFIYDTIERMSGVEVNVLMWGAVIIMVGGLCFGLRAKNTETKKEEA